MAGPDDTPDDMLMSAYAQGDAAAFERLYARHQAGLYRFIRRLLGTSQERLRLKFRKQLLH